jgi:GNAT superfamily N-acetyltransferase
VITWGRRYAERGLAGLENAPRPGGPVGVMIPEAQAQVLADTVTPPPESPRARGSRTGRRGGWPTCWPAIAVPVQSWRAPHRGLLPNDVLADLSISDRERFWSDTLTAPVYTRIVVAAIGDAIVGFAATGPPPVPDDRADPTLGDLYALYVDPDVWRRGIGTQLHAAAPDRLRSCGFTHAGLWVLDTNERALRFYNHHGPTDTGRTQVDHGPGGTELHERRLQRDLSD